MQVTEQYATRSSEADFSRRLQILSDSGSGVIHVRTSEVVRATLLARKAILLDNGIYKEWDIGNGWRSFDLQNINQMTAKGDGNIIVEDALALPLNSIAEAADNEEVMHFFVYVSHATFCRLRTSGLL